MNLIDLYVNHETVEMCEFADAASNVCAALHHNRAALEG